MTNTDPKARMANLLRAASTEVLITSLRTLADSEAKTAETRLVHAMTIDELERRYPRASDAVEAAFDADPEGDIDYAGVLIAAVLTEQLR